MKKRDFLMFVIGAVIATTLTVGASHVFDASDVAYNPTDENWNVENANEAIESLKSDLEESKLDVENYKTDIVDALSSKGIDVNNESSMEDITDKISNMKGTSVYYLGSGNSFDLKSKFPESYSIITSDKIIVQPKSMSGMQYSHKNSNPVLYGRRLDTSALTYGKSYNQTTGVLTVKLGGTVTGGAVNDDVTYFTHNISTTFDAYLIIGDIDSI